MNKLIVVALAFATLVCAADEARVTKIVPVKNGDVGQVYQTVHEVLNGMGLSTRMYQNNVVLSGSAEAVAAAEQLIKNLESAAPRERDVDVTGYVVLASAQAGEGGAVPADLEPVLKQFRNLLTYKSFRVLDTILLRAKENSEANTEGFLPMPNVSAPAATAKFRVARTTITDDVVHLKGLVLYVMVPVATAKGQYMNQPISISTDADMKAGQKVAIGKASVDANGAALILVVSANVVN